ncbi:MAG: replicative DNA helicase [Spirulina sp. SIO3F2]|nr:replicative DNA helicase [Spirulina sp. SIO3F2]
MPDDFTALNQMLPPQNLEAEELILGGVLLDPEGMGRVADIINPEAFYDTLHKDIYRAMITLHRQGRPTDLMTVTSWLQDHDLLDKIGGTAKLAQLVERTVSAVNIDRYAGLIMDKFVRRQLIGVSYDIAGLGYDTTQELEQVLDQSEQKVFALTQERPQQGLTPISDTLVDTFNTLESLQEKTALPGLNCGFYDLDAMTSGLQRSDLIILAGRPSMGKCLGKGTKVVMFDGTLKAVENIQINDLLMGADSKPRQVLSLARGREMMYWIRQKRGIDYRVNESHILSLKASGSEGRRVHGEIVNISVRDYLNKSSKFQQRHKGYKVEVDFSAQAVPIDPYLLGLWLGDGKATDGRHVIFGHNNIAQEVIAELQAIAVRDGYRLSHSDNGEKCDAWTLCAGQHQEGLKPQLRRVGLLDEKLIPLCYLANSKAVRLELLAGLMDSDGYYCRDMQCFENTQKRRKLAEQIKFLADSLGFRTSLISKKGVIKDRDFVGDYWRVRVSGNLEIIPTRIKYKQARKYVSNQDWHVTGITVEPDCVDDYYGFELDGDRLFLLEDMTVTHNTALGLGIAANIAKLHQLPIAVFSLEMSKEQLTQRLLAAEANIESNRLRSGNITTEELEKVTDAIGSLAELPIYIDDTASLTVMQMRSQVRRLQAEQGGRLGMVLLDYLQLMEGGGDNRVQELSKITRSLKGLAREVNAPVIALSQLSRGVESRTNKRPMMSDLRESGSIEQDADLILMLYRDVYYNPDSPDQNAAELILTKHRNGPTGTVRLLFQPELTKFENLAL